MLLNCSVLVPSKLQQQQTSENGMHYRSYEWSSFEILKVLTNKVFLTIKEQRTLISFCENFISEKESYLDDLF